MLFQNQLFRGGTSYFRWEMYFYATWTSHIYVSYSPVLSDGAHFFIWWYLPSPLISEPPKLGDGDFYLYSRSGSPSDFRENTGISLQNAPRLSAIGPIKPRKYCQRKEDFNFRIQKFPSATLQKFLPPTHKRQFVGTTAGFAYKRWHPQITFCA